MKIDKFRLLVILTVGLLILNLGTLAFLFLQKKGGHHRVHKDHHKKRPEQLIVHRLKFDDSQRKSYRLLIDEHRESIAVLEDERRQLKDELFSSLNTNDSLLEEKNLNRLAEIQKAIETAHLKHLKGIKSICKDDQLDDFEELSRHLGRIFHPRSPKKHGKHKRKAKHRLSKP